MRISNPNWTLTSADNGYGKEQLLEIIEKAISVDKEEFVEEE